MPVSKLLTKIFLRGGEPEKDLRRARQRPPGRIYSATYSRVTSERKQEPERRPVPAWRINAAGDMTHTFLVRNLHLLRVNNKKCP